MLGPTSFATPQPVQQPSRGKLVHSTKWCQSKSYFHKHFYGSTKYHKNQLRSHQKPWSDVTASSALIWKNEKQSKQSFLIHSSKNRTFLKQERNRFFFSLSNWNWSESFQSSFFFLFDFCSKPFSLSLCRKCFQRTQTSRNFCLLISYILWQRWEEKYFLIHLQSGSTCHKYPS